MLVYYQRHKLQRQKRDEASRQTKALKESDETTQIQEGWADAHRIGPSCNQSSCFSDKVLAGGREVILTEAVAYECEECAPRHTPVRIFTDFDDTIYSSMRSRHVTFAAGSD